MPQQHYSSPLTSVHAMEGAMMPQRTFLIMLKPTGEDSGFYCSVTDSLWPRTQEICFQRNLLKRNGQHVHFLATPFNPQVTSSGDTSVFMT